jgi:AraC family transcriptional regulator, alkane utilization regulator
MALGYFKREEYSGAADAVVNRLADILFIEAVRTYFSAPDAQKLRLSVALRDRRIGAALAAIHRLPEGDRGLAALAKQAAMSRTSFATRFKALVGESPHFYITRCRINKAVNLLLSSNATVSQVARRVGYSSEVGFGRAFKRYVGTSPNAYRKRAARNRPDSA